jgi:hypothetical protein
MRPSFFKRLKRAIRQEFRRINDQHKSKGNKRRKKKLPLSVRFRHWIKNRQSKIRQFRQMREERAKRRRRKPPVSVRFRHWVKKAKTWRFKIERRRPARPQMPPLSKRVKSYFHKLKDHYGVIFSSKYLIITFNSTVIFLVSFFLIHFLTHLVTGITCWFSEISTTLNFTFVDFHIRYWNWTTEMVIVVFSVPALFALIITLLSSLAFVKQLKKPKILNYLRYLTKKQRYNHKKKQREKELLLQVQRLNNTAPQSGKPKIRKRISWPIRLFLLWTLYHSTTYFFSGMLYAFLFHRRFGYVIWYAFDAFLFDVIFSVFAFLSLLIIGYAFSVQFFHSGRMYLNDLNDKNRMPFVLSQAIFPFIIGTIVTTAMQIPVFDPSLILLNFSIFFLLLPLPSRAVRYENLHFDNREKTAKIYWKWVVGSVFVIVLIYVALKIGIPLRLS